ncbi:MAG: hypothetical protein SPM02_02785 [Bacteroidales bacterium]|nr:hypothetical protein [Bacteroidales bacterium]
MTAVGTPSTTAQSNMLSEGDGSIVLHGYGNDSRDALKCHCRIVDYIDCLPQKLAMSGISPLIRLHTLA